MDRQNAILGVLTADAASMGLHWLYDQEHIGLIENTGDLLFRQPDAAHYKERKGYFAHSGKLAGDLSHYGESARVMWQLVKVQPFDVRAYQLRFEAAFGACGTYQGYADRPTKALIARMITDGEDLIARSGMDDNQMPAFCVLGGMFAAGNDLTAIEAAAAVISVHDDVMVGVKAVTHCLELVAAGTTLTEALNQSAVKADGELGQLLSEALQMKPRAPLPAATHFGMACYVHHALPVVWYLLNSAESFESVVRDNIRCGGDSCGRSMALGAIAGLAFGVPDSMTGQLGGATLPLRRPLLQLHQNALVNA